MTAPPKDEACGRRLVSLVLVKRRLYCAGSSCGAGLSLSRCRWCRDGLLETVFGADLAAFGGQGPGFAKRYRPS